MDLNEQKRHIVNVFLQNNLLMSGELLEFLDKEHNVQRLHTLLSGDYTPDLLTSINENTTDLFGSTTSVVLQKKEDPVVLGDSMEGGVIEVSCPEVTTKKRVLEDFVLHLRKRYTALQEILLQRRELQEKVLSINKILLKKEREVVGVIGLVKSKETTKNGNFILEVEDLSGTIKVLVNKTKQEVFDKAKDIVLDEVLGLVGTNGDNIIFANDIFFPEVPLHKEVKKCPEEVYAIFLSDIHFGSKNFLKEEFEKFLLWVNGDLGNEKHKEMSSKVKYVFVTGDMVDGVGVYPNQDEELEVKDIYAQYKLAADYLSRIPSHINIIICPGNHDAMRLNEPQPRLYEDIAKPIYELKNASIVTNPAMVNIHKTKDFPGFDVLMYHGYSYVYYGDTVDSLREKGGIDRTDLIMRFLLQKRHLAPTHGSALYIPEPSSDQLVISKVPDIFVSGHVHKASIAEYRGITTVCSSCWQSITSFEEKLGLHPEPARLPVLNLQTRKTHIIKFGND